jgi:hypothetical protein
LLANEAPDDDDKGVAGDHPHCPSFADIRIERGLVVLHPITLALTIHLEDTLQALQPDNDDENEKKREEDASDVEDVEDDAAASDECDCECSCKGTCEYEYDWSKVKELFARQPPRLEFYAIGFALTTPVELAQLPVPKHAADAHLYTAAFFCRTGADWFIYRVIFALKRVVTSEELPEIYKRLEQGAYVQLTVRRRTKHPVTYFRDIVLHIY